MHHKALVSSDKSLICYYSTPLDNTVLGDGNIYFARWRRLIKDFERYPVYNGKLREVRFVAVIDEEQYWSKQ